MATELKLTDGTTTIDFSDGATVYRRLGFSPQRASCRQVWRNPPQYPGGDLVASQWENVTEEIRFSITAASTSDLIDKINDINGLLIQAERYQIKGYGNQVWLQYKPKDSSYTGQALVLTGKLILPRDFSGTNIIANIAEGCVLRLTRHPFWEGDKEELENHLFNPGMEEWSQGADAAPDKWALTGDGASVARSTTLRTGAYGLYSAEVTAPTGITANLEQSLTAADYQGDTLTMGYWGTYGLTSNAQIRIGIGDNVNGITWSDWKTTAGFELLTVTHSVAGEASDLTLYLSLENNSDINRIANWDDGFLQVGTSLPTAWASGRKLTNVWDAGLGTGADYADHIPYIDIHGIPGDVPAKTRFYIDAQDDVERIFLAHTSHDIHDEGGKARLWHEGQGDPDDTCSQGERAKSNQIPTAGEANKQQVVQWVIADAPLGYFRILVRASGYNTVSDPVVVAFRYTWLQDGITTTSDWMSWPATGGSLPHERWRLKDMGTLSILAPCIRPESEMGDIAGTLTIEAYWVSGATELGEVYGLCDYVMLFPVSKDGYLLGDLDPDFGLDSLISPAGIYYYDANMKITGQGADYTGGPLYLRQGSDGNRIYLLRNYTDGADKDLNDITHTHYIKVAYIPRFLMLRDV